MFTPLNFKIKPKYSNQLTELIKKEIQPINIELEVEENGLNTLSESQLLKLDFYGIEIKNYPLCGKLSIDTIDAIAELFFIKKIFVVGEIRNLIEAAAE